MAAKYVNPLTTTPRERSITHLATITKLIAYAAEGGVNA